ARPRPAAITDVFVITSWRKKEISLQMEIEADSPQNRVIFSADIFDEEGKKAITVTGKPVNILSGKSVQEIKAEWENPTLWELDGGYLYTARVTLSINGKEVDNAKDVKFGFREIWTEGNKLMMNGHLSRWRMTVHLFDNANAMSFYQLIGYNMTQSVWPPLWWTGRASDTPRYDEKMLLAADQSGFAIMLPAGSLFYLRDKLLTDTAVRADYEREVEYFIRLYRNHPSILAWIVSMNTFNPRENISPQGMGKDIRGVQPEPVIVKVFSNACEIVKRHDPTRLAYSHADGGTGDMASSNVYLNFVPLQEREEWPMEWARTGDLPYQAAEFGQPATCNFWKGKHMWLTEYFAIYFGDQAYLKEGENGLRRTLEYGLASDRIFGAMNRVDLADYPTYWDFQRLFVRNTNRAWRTWGVNGGWGYWNYDMGYGDPPALDKDKRKPSYVFTRYNALKEPAKTKPDWANPNFDIHSQANQPLCVYLAGYPRHTGKDHAFFADEKVTKQIAVVWDGPGDTLLDCGWSLDDKSGKSLASGTVQIKVGCGDVKLVPFNFTAPMVSDRSEYLLTLTTRQDGKEIAGDSFALQVFPRVAKARLKANVALYDPTGKTGAWLKELGVETSDWKPGAPLNGTNLLVVGREALKPGDAMPYFAEDIALGLRVLILEQKPEVWKGLGFRTIDVMPRYVYASYKSSPILSGLQPEDLINWRGSPDLLPEGKNMPSETEHVPKWTNTHALVSVALQIPREVGFVPVLATEFDLDYSPLLEWRYGKGGVWFCSLDLTGRVGIDPSATLLARNLLRTISSSAPSSTRTVYYAGGVKGKALLERLGTEPVDSFTPVNAPEKLLVLGEGETKLPLQTLEQFVSDGGIVFSLPKKSRELAAYGLKAEFKTFCRIPLPSNQPFFRSIGPNLLRWRDAIVVDAFTGDGQPKGTLIVSDGLFAVWPMGKGIWFFDQLEPDLLEGRYPDNKDKEKSNLPSVIRLEQLVARLLTNCGAEPSRLQAERLAMLDLGSAHEPLKSWHVLGPYFVDKSDGDLMLSTKFPGEEMAVAGDYNPNPTFTNSKGKALDWRGVAIVNEKGYVDLSATFGGADNNAVGYAIATINSETERDAILRLGADWRMMVWVNGEPVFHTLKGLVTSRMPGIPYKVKIHLKKGKNLISCKVGSGNCGFGFYMELAKPQIQSGKEMPEKLRRVSFYAERQLSDEFDPYTFFYW
ncbi:MAG: hypothetical protein WC657_07705, partial [Candidatus Paceibacterota bacterium]